MWGTRWTPDRGTWWSRSSWGKPSSTSTCSLLTDMRWEFPSIRCRGTDFLARWIWTGGCSTRRRTYFLFTLTSWSITSRCRRRTKVGKTKDQRRRRQKCRTRYRETWGQKLLFIRMQNCDCKSVLPLLIVFIQSFKFTAILWYLEYPGLVIEISMDSRD